MYDVTRRQILRSGGATLGGVLLSSTLGNMASGAEGGPVRGGHLVVRRSSAWTTMDAHLSRNADPDYPLMFDYLTQYRRNKAGEFEVHPGLAESWSFVDDLTLELKLREGVLFHDGSPFDAEVAAWNLRRMQAHEQSAAKANTASIGDIEVVSGQVLRLRLKQPNAALLVNLSSAADSTAAMLSQAHVEAVGDQGAASHPIGTGPFKFVSWVENGSVRWERWDQYWAMGEDQQPLPYPDTVESVLQANDQTAILRLRSGDIHIIDGVLGSQIPILQRDRKVALIHTPWQANLFTLVFNAREGARFAGPEQLKIRQAVFASINKEAVALAVGKGVGLPIHSPFIEGQVGYSQDIRKHVFDQELSRKLLSEAGVGDGLKITLDVIARQDDVAAAQFYQQMLADVGIVAELRTQDRVAWVSRIRSGDFELGSFFGRGRAEADSVATAFFSEGGANNYAGIKDPLIADLLDSARGTYEPAAREKIYGELMARIVDESYYNFVWNRTGVIAVSRDVSGFEPPFFGTIPDSTTVSIAD